METESFLSFSKSKSISYVPWLPLRSLGLILSTAFWIFSLIHSPEVNAVSTLKNSACILALCFGIEFLVKVTFCKSVSRLTTVHYLLGILQQISFISLYIIGSGIFFKSWPFIYFGYYIWTSLSLITRPEGFFRKFRIFYSIHHTFSFLITGTWLLVRPCCKLNNFLIRGVMLWLSSEIYLYICNLYRSLNPSLNMKRFRKFQLIAFIAERIQRLSAYIQAFVISSMQLSTFEWVVLGTGIANDILDICFQLKFVRVAIIEIFGSQKPKLAADDDTDIESAENEKGKSLSEDIAIKSPGPFNYCDPNILDILSHSDFNRKQEIGLSTQGLQDITSKRLRHFTNMEALYISKMPGMKAYEKGHFPRFLEANHFIGMYDISLYDVLGVHWIGGSVIFIHGNDQQVAETESEVDNMKAIYCFCATEITHGSNLKNIQTNAYYEEATDKFTLSTPNKGSSKFWITNATELADYAVVLSNIFIGGEKRAVGWFRVPLWESKEKTNRYPGVEVRDIIERVGCNGIGSGCISFNDVKISSKSLMQRFVSISEDRIFSSQLSMDESFLRSIQTFLLERIGVAAAALGSATATIYIALKYATVRHQFGPKKEPEIPLISYALHRHRLFPHVARIFIAKSLINYGGAMSESMFNPFVFDSKRKELHALSCMIKSFVTWDSFAASQESRECCGGHGYATVSQVGSRRNDLDLTLTFAGDNTLLCMEVVRYRIKQVLEWSWLKKLFGPRRPSLAELDSSSVRDPSSAMRTIIDVLTYREERLLWDLAKKLRGPSEQRFENFTRYGAQVKELSEAIYDRISIATWTKHYTSNSEFHAKIGLLDGVVRLKQHAGWLLSHSIITDKTHKSFQTLQTELYDYFAKNMGVVFEELKIPKEIIKECPLVHSDYAEKLFDASALVK